MNRPRSRRIPALAMLCAAGLALACSDDGSTLFSARRSLDAAKGGGGTVTVAVDSTTPSFGSPGTINEVVTITGSGFQPGAQASWLFVSDTVDTTITVVSTHFLSATTLTSVITISPTSQVAFRNVKVTNADRTKGIGNAVFEITQAIAVPSAGIFRGVNDHGEFTGGAPNGVVYWSAATGPVAVNNASGQGFDISPMGNVIAANGLPHLYVRPGPVGTPWTSITLPVDPNASLGNARAVLTDPVSGQPVLAGGRQIVPITKKLSIEEPLVWAWHASTSSWVMQVLPSGSVGQAQVRGISPDTTIIGWLGGTTDCCDPGPNGIAAVWRSDSNGVWHLTTIGPTGSGTQAINAAGTMIVGQSAGQAVYWQRTTAGTWSSPVVLPGGCTAAVGVDTVGRILVTGCVGLGEPAGVMLPPYSAANIRPLGGLGPHNAAYVAAMSPSGQYVAGQTGGVGAVYWKMF